MIPNTARSIVVTVVVGFIVSGVVTPETRGE